ncbi:MAG TPA: thioredoxin-dependent thiol peroxidase [Rhodobacteraceae bacterium]|nr:thioredoxin-dependent thiol peroxidase [Paracoccaceae bacterium]
MSTELVRIGAKAPDFALPRDGGEMVSLADFAGRPVVVFFYPKASTPGCTTEACDFTARMAGFEAAGAAVLGISKDTVKRQETFAAKQDLSMPLLSDAQGDVCERYGVWAEKKNYGRTYMGIVRTTVLIAGDGTIAQVWTKVKVAGHAEAVLAAVQSL